MVYKKSILVILSVFAQISLQVEHIQHVADVTKDFYTAAVVQFSPHVKQEDNLKDYEWFVTQAKFSEADIIVFPENGLHGTDGNLESKLSVVPAPDERKIPCRDGDSKSEVIGKLSCMALDNVIYVVVNLLESVPCTANSSNCPPEERIIYSTNVVFDKKGMVVSRYRKLNAVEENEEGKISEAELEYFDSDFGVRFGSFISFDILLKSPGLDLIDKYNVTNFIYPNYWYGELPFFTALQIQNGWSYSMNVNLLAAGTSNPSTGTGGSGIYLGRKGPVIFSMPDTEMSIALIGKVPKNVRAIMVDNKNMYETHIIKLGRKEGVNVTETRMQLKKDPTTINFESVVLDEDDNDYKGEICSNGLCCRFKIRYEKRQDTSEDSTNKGYIYRAVAYKGDKTFSQGSTGAVEVCAVILCTGPNLEDCGNRPEPLTENFLFKKISIEGSFNNNQTIQMPSTLVDYDNLNSQTKLLLLGAGHYSFVVKEEANSRTVKMVLKDNELKNLLTFGIYSRDFSKSEGISLTHSTLSLTVVALIFGAYF